MLEPDCVLLLLATSPCLVRSLNCLTLVMGLFTGLSPPRSRDYMITEKAFISASPGSTTMHDPPTTWKHLLWTLSKTICKLSEANEAEKKMFSGSCQPLSGRLVQEGTNAFAFSGMLLRHLWGTEALGSSNSAIYVGEENDHKLSQFRSDLIGQ